jgi:hypothetical protein
MKRFMILLVVALVALSSVSVSLGESGGSTMSSACEVD